MFQKTTLPNGIRVLTSNMPYTRSVSTGIFIGSGSRYENKELSGASHFIEHMLFKGTHKRPTSKDISEAVEGVGGILNGETDKELTLYWIKVARPYFSLSLDVLTDMLLKSKFEPADIDKERMVIIEEINRSKDVPSQEVDLVIDQLLWPDHPLGYDIAGTRESVINIDREKLLDFMGNQYLPENMVFAIAGDVQHDEMVEAVDKIIGTLPRSRRLPVYAPFSHRPNSRISILKRDSEQVHLCLAVHGYSLFHPKRFVLDILNAILGAGMSSRLFTEVRDKLGIAYAIQSYVDHFLDSGSLTVYAGVEPKRLAEAVKAILEQLAFLKETVPEPELIKAKELSKGRLLLRMEDSHAVSGWMGGQETLTGEILTVDQVINLIDGVTAAQIKEVAQALLTAEELRLAVVGPVDKTDNLEDLLKI